MKAKPVTTVPRPTNSRPIDVCVAASANRPKPTISTTAPKAAISFSLTRRATGRTMPPCTTVSTTPTKANTKSNSRKSKP